jgi:enoyl-CoA hydratase/carnithine racemase
MKPRLRVETDLRGCRTLWLDRPDKRNALDEPFLQELLDAASAASSDEVVRAVLVRSTSPMFCAGADLNEWADVTPREAQRLSALGSRAFQALADLPVPVVAALEGPALGGGLELAMACDIRIGSTACRVGYPEPRLGNSPAWGGMARLIDAVGKSVARDMLLTGDPVDAKEAHRVGVLQRLHDSQDFQPGLERLIDSIVACDGGTLTYIKALLGAPAAAVAAQEAAIAGFTATRLESRERKEAFLASRRKPSRGTTDPNAD